MNVVIYVRVSTQEQAREGYSIGEQVERLTKYCEAMGWNIVESFIDPGYSGGDMKRPGLKSMMKYLEAEDVDKVVVYKLDRLSRSQKDTLYLIEDVFLKNGTDFVSMNENFDTSTPFGRAMIGILAVFAQLEREQIKERMSMGKEARAKEGKWNGGNNDPIGYDYNPAKDLLEVNEYEAMQVRELYDLFLSGMPLRTIERTFAEKGYRHKHGTWSTRTLRGTLRRKTHLGYVSYQGVWYKGEHIPIITEEQYNAAAVILDKRAEQFQALGVKAGVQTTYLGGLLHCKRCGAKYAKDRQKQRNGKEPRMIYVCYSRCKRMKAMVKDPNCKNKIWTMGELDNIVLEEIRQCATDPGYIDRIRNEKRETDDDETPEKIRVLEAEIAKLDGQISRFLDLYGIGKFTIDQVQAKIDPLNDTRKNLMRELDLLNSEAGRLTAQEARQIVSTFEEVVDGGDFDEIRDLIEALIYYIDLDGDDVYIHWKFA